MINRALFRKGIQESTLLFAGCGTLITLFCFFRVWVVGRIDSGRFRQIIDLVPKDWQRFSSVDFEWIVSYLGRTAMTLDEPLLVMLISAFAIVRGGDVVAGEVGRGTMEMVLSQPVSRRSVFWHQMLVTLLGLIALGLICLGAMAMAVQITRIKETRVPEIQVPLTNFRIPLSNAEPEEILVPMRDVVSAMDFIPGVINLICLAVFLAGMCSLVSSVDRFGWRAIGICVGIYFVFAMLKIGSMAAPSMHWLGWLTVFSLYEPELHVQAVQSNPESFWHWTIVRKLDGANALGPIAANSLLIGFGMVFGGVASRIFETRDLPAPT